MLFYDYLCTCSSTYKDRISFRRITFFGLKPRRQVWQNIKVLGYIIMQEWHYPNHDSWKLLWTRVSVQRISLDSCLVRLTVWRNESSYSDIVEKDLDQDQIAPSDDSA